MFWLTPGSVAVLITRGVAQKERTWIVGIAIIMVVPTPNKAGNKALTGFGGFSKADAAIDDWINDFAPSTELREWFGHDPKARFSRRCETGKVACSNANSARKLSRSHCHCGGTFGVSPVMRAGSPSMNGDSEEREFHSLSLRIECSRALPLWAAI